MLSFEEFEKEALAVIKPPFQSQFGGRRWGDIGREKTKYEWLVKGMIARREVAWMAGPSQIGKSYLATDLAMSVARGVDWLGKKVKRGAVAYVAAESQQGVISLRLPAYAKHHGLTWEDDIPILVLTRSPNFYTDAEGVKKLIEEIKAFEADVGIKVELVVIDTFSAATRGIDELSGRDLGRARENFSAIVDDVQCTCLIVHHTNASGTRMKGNGQNFNDANDVLLVNYHENKRDADGRPVRFVETTKVKEGPNKQRQDFVLKGVMLGLDEDGEAIPSCVVARPDVVEAAPAEKQKSFGANEGEMAFLQCLSVALGKSGEAPPPGLQVPANVALVAPTAAVKTVFTDRLSSTEVGDEKEVETKLRARWSRATKSLLRYGVIGTSKTHIWLTGRPVRGFSVRGASQLHAPAPERGEAVDPVADQAAANVDDSLEGVL